MMWGHQIHQKRYKCRRVPPQSYSHINQTCLTLVPEWQCDVTVPLWAGNKNWAAPSPTVDIHIVRPAVSFLIWECNIVRDKVTEQLQNAWKHPKIPPSSAQTSCLLSTQRRAVHLLVCVVFQRLGGGSPGEHPKTGNTCLNLCGVQVSKGLYHRRKGTGGNTQMNDGWVPFSCFGLTC